MAGPMMGGMNPLMALLSPDQQQSYMQLQQQQMLGQAMLQQGMQPMDAGQNAVGGVAYRVSPLNGIAKVLNVYLGNKMAMDSMGKQAQLMGQMYGNAFGTTPQPQPEPQQAPVDAGGMTGDQSGPGVQSVPVATPGAAPSGAQLGAAMGGGAAQAAPQTQMPNGALTLPGKTPQQSMLLFSMLGPDAYGKMLEAQMAPTDATRMARAANMDPVAANRDALLKANNLPFNTYAPNSILQDPRTGQMSATPSAAPEGSYTVLTPNGPKVVQTPGALSAMQGAAAATAAGGAQFKPVQVYNPQTQQMEYSNEAAVTNPAAPAPVRNNNPGAMMPGGKLAQYPDMQTGLQALDQNLASYGKQGVNTIAGVISKWAPPNENDTQAYIKDVSQRLGIPPGQKIDLSNPLQRQALSTAIALHENGPAGVFGGGGGAPAAAPPLGAVDATNAAQTAPSKQMAEAYGNLSNADANYQQSRQSLTSMLELAKNQGIGGTAARLLPDGVATRISNDAAEYQKQHANYVNLQQKSLGSNGTVASLANINEAVPTYDKPQAAKIDGLTTQLNNLDIAHLKTQFLNPIYGQGDKSVFTAKNAEFDNNITPQMAPVLMLPPQSQRAAVQAAVKANPALRSNFEWAFHNGLLK